MESTHRGSEWRGMVRCVRMCRKRSRGVCVKKQHCALGSATAPTRTQEAPRHKHTHPHHAHHTKWRLGVCWRAFVAAWCRNACSSKLGMAASGPSTSDAVDRSTHTRARGRQRSWSRHKRQAWSATRAQLPCALDAQQKPSEQLWNVLCEAKIQGRVGVAHLLAHPVVGQHRHGRNARDVLSNSRHSWLPHTRTTATTRKQDPAAGNCMHPRTLVLRQSTPAIHACMHACTVLVCCVRHHQGKRVCCAENCAVVDDSACV